MNKIELLELAEKYDLQGHRVSIKLYKSNRDEIVHGILLELLEGVVILGEPDSKQVQLIVPWEHVEYLDFSDNRTFQEIENLLNLSSEEIGILLKQIEHKDLILALKSVSPELEQFIFSAVSSRAASMIKEDLSEMSPINPKDIKAAQRAIMNYARKLNES